MEQIFKNKKVLVTGHTGFKGTWLLHLLYKWGARIYGFSLAPKPHQRLFFESGADQLCEASVFDTIDRPDAIREFVESVQPDFVFHLAAQALVIDSYQDPAGTFMTNVMGTVHLLESLKTVRGKCIAVMVTTDKVYENNEDGRLYEEDDKLGGKDPYSASKACDEIVIASYKASFFSPGQPYDHILVSSVRAGNVIGGGDFSDNRIIPDLVRALEKGEKAVLRHPLSIRPWQHVLEPLSAYCLLAAKMTTDEEVAGAYNIGPYEADMLTVEELVTLFFHAYGKGSYDVAAGSTPLKEAGILKLNNNKIKEKIGFSPRLDAATAIRWTAQWYANTGAGFKDKCNTDIDNYLK